ncbi:MAG: hypothetical protein WBA93_01195 [Microcoleaceae cyanobacterium]
MNWKKKFGVGQSMDETTGLPLGALPLQMDKSFHQLPTPKI